MKELNHFYYVKLWIPALLAPLAAGIYLIRCPGHLHKLAGWFTLKPVVTTPLFLLILTIISFSPQWVNRSAVKFTALLPAILFTLLIAWSSRAHYRSEHVRILVILHDMDFLRWGVSGLIVILINHTEQWLAPLVLTALGLPTLYAILSLARVCSLRKKTAGTTT